MYKKSYFTHQCELKKHTSLTNCSIKEDKTGNSVWFKKHEALKIDFVLFCFSEMFLTLFSSHTHSHTHTLIIYSFIHLQALSQTEISPSAKQALIQKEK